MFAHRCAGGITAVTTCSISCWPIYNAPIRAGEAAAYFSRSRTARLTSGAQVVPESRICPQSRTCECAKLQIARKEYRETGAAFRPLFAARDIDRSIERHVHINLSSAKCGIARSTQRIYDRFPQNCYTILSQIDKPRVSTIPHYNKSTQLERYNLFTSISCLQDCRFNSNSI